MPNTMLQAPSMYTTQDPAMQMMQFNNQLRSIQQSYNTPTMSSMNPLSVRYVPMDQLLRNPAQDQLVPTMAMASVVGMPIGQPQINMQQNPTIQMQSQMNMQQNPTIQMQPQMNMQQNPTIQMQPQMNMQQNPTIQMQSQMNMQQNPTIQMQPQMNMQQNPTIQMQPQIPTPSQMQQINNTIHNNCCHCINVVGDGHPVMLFSNGI
ncbi:unnamed protein product, partial [Didymodactylos carnosus]